MNNTPISSFCYPGAHELLCKMFAYNGDKNCTSLIPVIDSHHTSFLQLLSHVVTVMLIKVVLL